MTEGFGLFNRAAKKQLFLSPFFRSSSTPTFYSSLPVCMQSSRSFLRRKGLQMHLPSKRFFLQVEGFYFLFLFFRGALT